MKIRSLSVGAFFVGLLFAGCPGGGGASSGSGGSGGGAGQADGGGGTAGGAAGADGSAGTDDGAAGMDTGAAGTGGSSATTRSATIVVQTPRDPLTAKTYLVPQLKDISSQRGDDKLLIFTDTGTFFGAKFGGDELSLRVGGLYKTGTFACGVSANPSDAYSIKTYIEVWTFVHDVASGLNTYKGSNAGNA